MIYDPIEEFSRYGISVSARRQKRAARIEQRFRRKYAATGSERYPLLARDNDILGPVFNLKQLVSGEAGDAIDYEKAVFIGTIRMGYGHYRIGMALASAAHAMGYVPYWHDLLGFDSAGARMIQDLEKWYSLGSRLSQKSKLFNRLLWDPLLGKWYRRIEKNYPAVQASTIFADTYSSIPPDAPFLATHSFNAHGALHAGLDRVVNIVPDNCPLGFHVAPGALHTVQSPSAYFIFRTLRGMGGREVDKQGIPAGQVYLTGHYIDHELTSNINTDCNARLARMDAHAPRRLLVSIGGAGAQQDLIIALVNHLLPEIRAERLLLFINCGDHKRMLNRLREGVPEFDALAQKHFDWESLQDFSPDSTKDMPGGLHVFFNENPFVAVYTTNMLMRISDILITKPSELAFYPIPKLLIERVGGHEAWGAIRAAELGDGVGECAGMPFTLQSLNLMTRENDLLSLCCHQIKRQHDIGVYDGAYKAVTLAATGSIDE